MTLSNHKANSLLNSEFGRRWYNKTTMNAEGGFDQEPLACIVVSHLQ